MVLKQKKPPPPSNLAASSEWVKWKFGVKGQAKGALTHVRKCLNEISSREYDFLMTKANLLGYLEEWKELKSLLKFLDDRYPNDPKVLLHQGEYWAAHGRWKKALSAVRYSERKISKNHFELLEILYSIKLDCLAALGRLGEAKREAKKILKKHKNFSIIRFSLGCLLANSYKKPKPYA